MNKYKTFEASFTFYADSDLSEMVEAIPGVTVEDCYLDEDGDWCIDCTAEIKTVRATKQAIGNKLSALIKHVPSCWDYHYIKGVDNDFWWQP